MHVSVKPGLSFAAAAAAAVLVWRFADAPASLAPVPSTPAVPVVVGPVQQGDVAIILSGLGTVQALNTATIRSQVSGLLQTIDFVEGQKVHKGDVLAQIDPRPYQARLEQTEAQLGHDQAQLANVEVNLNRYVPLLSRGFATDQQVTDQRFQILQLQSTIKSDQANIDDARTQLSYATLNAPFDGITGVRSTDVGNIIHSTDAEGLVTVTQVQPISVLLTLPAADIAQVQDALAKGTVKAVAFDQANTRTLDTGQLLLVNNKADPQSGTVQLKALFPNLQRLLWPGTFVNVELTTSVTKAALTVPNDAVQQGPQGTFVYIVGTGEKVAVRPIQVAQQLRSISLVSQGLSAGETVVVQGQYRLTAGTLVVPSKSTEVASSSTGTAGMLP